MNDDRIAAPHDIIKRIAARGQHIAVLFVVKSPHRRLVAGALGESARARRQCAPELFAVAQRQFPRKLRRRAVAIRAFDFDLPQRRDMQIAVAVHIDRSVAILAQKPALRIFGAAALLVMQIVGDEKILLGVQARLLVGIER